ncbi:MAG: sulfite exporter TauE/SafE family protein, partial [Calditrichia bacterium]
FLLWLVLGFIPCGLVYAAGAKAATTGNATAGLLTMVAFGLGTLPAMMLIGLGANVVSVQFRQRLFKVATVLVILLGIFSVYRGIKAISGNQMMHHQNHAYSSGSTTNLPENSKIYFSLF